jgi:hypothetical protein
MPRLPQSPRVSRKPNGFGAGSVRVSGASRLVGLVSTAGLPMCSPYAGIIRSGSSGRRQIRPPSQPGQSPSSRHNSCHSTPRQCAGAQRGSEDWATPT